MQQATREGLVRLRDAMAILLNVETSQIDALFGAAPEDQGAVEPQDPSHAFFRDLDDGRPGDTASSAGQVGRGHTIEEMLADGNVREMMTMMYNAAYAFYGAQTLQKLVMEVINSGRYELAEMAGLDMDLLARIAGKLDDSVVRHLLGSRREFQRDVFATGVVAMLSPEALRDVVAAMASQYSRRDRTEDEMAPLIATPADFEQVHAPLSARELALQAQALGVTIDVTTLLALRGGFTLHETDTVWTRHMEERGFPTADGISMTTAKMLTMFKLIGMSPEQLETLRGALMAWMLPCRDHSLIEIVRGAAIAQVGEIRVDGERVRVAIDMYRELTGIDLQTLRTVLPDGMLPHEAAYMEQAASGTLLEVTPAMRANAEWLFEQLSVGPLTDPALKQWLTDNGIDWLNDPDAVQNLAARLSVAHLLAFAVYTGPSHSLINAAVTAHMTSGMVPVLGSLVADRVVDAGVKHKAATLLMEYLRCQALNLPPSEELPGALRPLASTPEAGAWIQAERDRVDAEQRREAAESRQDRAEAKLAKQALDAARKTRAAARDALLAAIRADSERLESELRWHADMASDGIRQLPHPGTPENPVTAYRGDYITRGYSPRYGNRHLDPWPALSFMSTSTDVDVAAEFVLINPSANADNSVVVVYQLTGQSTADLSVFSAIPGEREITAPPGARFSRTDDPALEERTRQQLALLGFHDCRIIIMREG